MSGIIQFLDELVRFVAKAFAVICLGLVLLNAIVPGLGIGLWASANNSAEVKRIIFEFSISLAGSCSGAKHLTKTFSIESAVASDVVRELCE